MNDKICVGPLRVVNPFRELRATRFSLRLLGDFSTERDGELMEKARGEITNLLPSANFMEFAYPSMLVFYYLLLCLGVEADDGIGHPVVLETLDSLSTRFFGCYEDIWDDIKSLLGMQRRGTWPELPEYEGICELWYMCWDGLFGSYEKCDIDEFRRGGIQCVRVAMRLLDGMKVRLLARAKISTSEDQPPERSIETHLASIERIEEQFDKLNKPWQIEWI